MPKKKPEYRNDRNHTEFLRPMSEIYSHMDEIESEIMKSLGNEFDIEHLDTVALGLETARLLDDRDISELCRTKHVPLEWP
jgi:hypothetical protein